MQQGQGKGRGSHLGHLSYLNRWTHLSRAIALLTGISTLWLSLSPGLAAAAEGVQREKARQGHQRKLTALEMQRIWGAVASTQTAMITAVDRDVDGATGSSYPWEASVGGTNTVNGNKVTSLPIVGWKVRGGMSISLSLIHNSSADMSASSEVGYGWLHSYSIYGVVDNTTGDFSVRWGDGLGYKFKKQINGTFTAPYGVNDKLVQDSTGYTLTTGNQIRYRFSGGTGNRVNGISIQDRSGNQITIAHDSSDRVTSVTDPSGRSLTFSYSGSLLSSVTDPANRTFTFSRDSNGNLTGASFPLSTSVSYGYDSLHRITGVTDLRGKVWTFGYAGSGGALLWEKNPLNQQTSYSYFGGVTTISNPLNRSTTYSYNGSGQLASVTDAGSRTASYAYSNFRKSSVTSPGGQTYPTSLEADISAEEL